MISVTPEFKQSAKRVFNVAAVGTTILACLLFKNFLVAIPMFGIAWGCSKIMDGIMALPETKDTPKSPPDDEPGNKPPFPTSPRLGPT